MKISAVLTILAVTLAEAKLEEAEKLEQSFERALGNEERDLWGGGGWGACCEWVCEEPEPEPEPEPCVYRSKAMMMGGSYGGDDCGYYGSGMSMRRVKEANMAGVTTEKADRELWGYPMCEWDCSGCDVGPGPIGPGPGPIGPGWPGVVGPGWGGHQCFPTSSTNEDCSCTCCGVLPPVIVEPEPEPEPEPCYYRSKAMMMGGSYWGGDDCGYDYGSGMSMRRVKETERKLPGKGWGGGWGGKGWGGGPGIWCSCDCDPPSPPPPVYRSKAMMMGGSYWY